jgi:hypothetical protein
MTTSVRQLTLKEFNLLPDNIYKHIKGKFVLTLNGEKFYGFYSAKDAYKALKPQKVEKIYKFNERN